ALMCLCVISCSYDVQHPVYSPTAEVDELLPEVQKVMEMSDEEIRGLISDKTDFSHVGCEACRGGSEYGRAARFTWSIDNPWQITCEHCGQVYPSDKYPMDKTLTIVNPVGEEQEYHYHQAEDGRAYFWNCKIRGFIKNYMAGRAYDLAVLYHLTGEEKYAHKASVIVHRFAEVYPAWPIRGFDGYQESPWADIQFKPSEGQKGSAFYDSKILEPDYQGNYITIGETPMNMPYWAGKWSRWFYGDIPQALFKTHDLIYQSDAYETISPDARETVERDLLRLSVDTIQKWPKRYGNMDGHRIMGFVMAGRILGEPDWVHYAVNWVQELLEKSYFYDGMWHEGTACYHRQITNRLAAIPDLADGHTDPPGYTYEPTGRRFDDLKMTRDLPALDRSIKAVYKLTLPLEQGKNKSLYAATHDSWWDKKSHGFTCTKSEPQLLPGMGHAVLGWGEDANQMQAHLHYSGASGHDHRDTLNIILHAKGTELLSEFGYCRTTLRGWSNCTPAHNTVVVDETEQTRGFAGNLMLFAPAGPEVFAVEADGTSRYESIADIYQRALVFARIGEEDGYLFDVFNTRGGQSHDWMLHSYANEDPELDVSLPLSSVDGTMYTHITDLRLAVTDEQWSMTHTCEDGSALKTYMLGATDTEVIAGRCPSIRPAPNDESKTHDYHMPIVAVRRTGPEDEDLSSTFVAVHEPYKEDTSIVAVRSLPVQGAPDAVAVAVVMDDFTDYIIHTGPSLESARVSLEEMAITFDGRLAHIRAKNGTPQRMHIFDGSMLKVGDNTLQTAGPLQGTITGVERHEAGDARNGFATDTGIPEGVELAGQTLILTHGDGSTHGYTIESVQNTGQGSFISVEDEPGLRIEGNTTTQIYFPHRTIEGPNTFRICAEALMRVDEEGQASIERMTSPVL
ncbi:MAG: heparinase II/III family protein, partial [Armatimonadota bacterium]